MNSFCIDKTIYLEVVADNTRRLKFDNTYDFNPLSPSDAYLRK